MISCLRGGRRSPTALVVNISVVGIQNLAQCIVIGPVCGFVCLWMCSCVCYHDNSKLHASIFTKLGL